MELEEEPTVRRSERTVRSKRAYSPETTQTPNYKTGKKVKGSRKGTCKSRSAISIRPHAASQELTCSQCKNSYTASQRKPSKITRMFTGPTQETETDPNLNHNLCTTCIVQKEPKKQKAPPSEADKEKYLQEAKSFAASLVDILHDSLAHRLYCPEFKTQPCACLQKFILARGLEESKSRATLLLTLLKDAKKLSELKCYNLEQTAGSRTKTRMIGLGNGQKRSLQFEQFVLEKRAYLRGPDVHLCERATQRVLVYSNNFLHKKLKTEPEKGTRVQRQKGKCALGQLPQIEDLPGQTCCMNSCVLMASTHAALLLQWRQRTALGQAEARRVLAEMLTPCGGGKFNCFNFITLVTGVSHCTISKVNEQMKRTGGEREPPEHGLKKWWQEQAKRPRQQTGLKSNETKDDRLHDDKQDKMIVNEEVHELEEAVNRIPLPEPSEICSPPTTHLALKTSVAPVISQLGTSFIIPSHFLLGESRKSLSRLPLILPSLGSTVTLKTSSPIAAPLHNTQILSQVIFDEESVKTHLINSSFENVILVRQPTKVTSAVASNKVVFE